MVVEDVIEGEGQVLKGCHLSLSIAIKNNLVENE